MFRLVDDFPGYRVSNLGRVQSCWIPGRHAQSDQWHDITARLDHGYWIVSLQRNRKSRPVAVHLLVATAFLGPCPPGKECMIVGDNRSDPRTENLRWATPVEIAAEKDRQGRLAKGERVASAKLTEKEVRAARLRYTTGSPMAVLARRYGVSHKAMHNAVWGVTWKHVQG